MKRTVSPLPLSKAETLILRIRGQRVVLDQDLAELYGVPTKVLNQAVRRNRSRFPDDFMFQLTVAEQELQLRSQVVTSIDTGVQAEALPLRSQPVTSKQRRGGRRYLPFAFTEQGVAMLSSVLRSASAIRVNIEIMRAFVRLRSWLASNQELSRRLEELERKYDAQFRNVFDAIRALMKDELPPRREIGFHTILNGKDARRKNTRRLGGSRS